MDPWKRKYYENCRNGNRQSQLHELVPVIRLFFSPSLGVIQGEWCQNHCEGLWNFHNWWKHLLLKESSITIESCCEFHFELENDASLFKLSWLNELNFTP